MKDVLMQNSRQSHTLSDSRLFESSESVQKRERQRVIKVTVPDPKEIGVVVPGADSKQHVSSQICSVQST